ncbi:uncharacterized protein [Diabrotica undecimpunctata]|uniref:uncharacterized protein n=1 Tax=Diabrotica undecimpunctata TaxID=50387 RepID=UPI003B638F1D
MTLQSILVPSIRLKNISLIVISQDHCYARSTRCMEQENYRDYAENVGVLNDHNYASCSKEYNSKVTVDTTLPFNETTEQGPKNILRQCGIRRNDLTPKKKKLYTEMRRLYKKLDSILSE